MLHQRIDEIAEDAKQQLGLIKVFTCYNNGINTEYVNYGYIRSLTDDEAKMYAYREIDESCGYEATGDYIFVCDLNNCSDVKVVHDIIVTWFMSQDVIVTGSGYDATAIFMHETESSKYWESDNHLIAVWFSVEDETNPCNQSIQDYCIIH